MVLKDVLIGIGLAWVSLTPEGKKVRDMAIKKVMDKYLVPKEEKVKKDDDEEA